MPTWAYTEIQNLPPPSKQSLYTFQILQAKYEASEQRFKEVQALLQQGNGPLTFGNASSPSEVSMPLCSMYCLSSLWNGATN